MLSGRRRGLWMEVVAVDSMCLVSEKKESNSKEAQKKKKENALPKGKGFVESSSELFDIYNGLWG